MFEFNLIIIGAGSIVLIEYVSSRVWKKRKEKRLIFMPKSDNYKSVPISYLENSDFTFDINSDDILEKTNHHINKNSFYNSNSKNLI